MNEWFKFSMNGLWAICLTGIGIYLVIIVFTRLCGKRSFSKMNSFDFAITVALGSMVATTVLSKSVSLWDGIIGLAILYILQLSTAYLRRYAVFAKITDNTPLLLMDGAEILHGNLIKAKVTESDLRAKLREANVLELSQVRAVIFETTGDIAVLHTDDADQALEDWLISGVTR
ncbi:MAG: YetF domain-containing protein [Flavobacteriaceae bacterium]